MNESHEKFAPTGLPVLARTYSRPRSDEPGRETWGEVVRRTVYGKESGLAAIGQLTDREAKLLYDQMMGLYAYPAARALWIGGTKWAIEPENFSGFFNCTSIQLTPSKFDCSPWATYWHLMNLGMMGCGVGLVAEKHLVEQFPAIVNRLNVVTDDRFGFVPKDERREATALLDTQWQDGRIISTRLVVGDSREGWAMAYQSILDLASHPEGSGEISLTVDLTHVRPKGERLSRFGGTANPSRLSTMFEKIAHVLNHAVGRQLFPLEAVLIAGLGADAVVSGGIRRFAGMVQFSSDDDQIISWIGTSAIAAKQNLWVEDKDGNWSIDPIRDPLRTANHTVVFHQKPTRTQCIESVRSQFQSGEGAIQWAGEAVARANRDILSSEGHRQDFLNAYSRDRSYARLLLDDWMGEPRDNNWLGRQEELDHRMARYGLNPCLAGETIVPYHDVTSAVDEDGCVLIEAMQATIKYLSEMTARGEQVWVCDGDGDWVESRFICTHPAAEIWEVVYQYDGEVHTIRTTGNHQFFLYDRSAGLGDPVEVSQLKPGQWLEPNVRGDGYDRFAEVISVTKTDAIEPVYCCTVPSTNSFDLLHLHSHNCGEVMGNEFHCNLATNALNLQDPMDFEGQRRSFIASSLAAASLLNQDFDHVRYQNSREYDPIILVSFTGLFDFFVKAFGVDWLRWWEAGRPDGWGDSVEGDAIPAWAFYLFSELLYWDSQSDFFRESEAAYLEFWRDIVESTVWDYCDRHELKRPNRCTGVKPEGTISNLTGASPGWHPPKAARFIRRITYRRDDPVARACMDYGYSVVPAQSDKDEDGKLLNDPFDPRCTEWLVEIPVAVDWADLPGADTIRIEGFSALAQFDFWMQVQRHYTTFNTSATIELTEDEIEPLGDRVYQAIQDDEGYISTALLARFNAPFPRLPFEKIDRETYDRLHQEVLDRRKSDDFWDLLARYDYDDHSFGPNGCDSGKCLMPEQKY
jgi:hypothetical protein